MTVLANRTPHAVAIGHGRDGEGRPALFVSVKATFGWDKAGRLLPVKAVPVLAQDELAGAGAQAVMLRASEVGPCKPRVDVLLAGAIVLPAAVEQIDATLEVGDRLKKTVTLAGSQPFTRMPIDWRLMAGGSSPGARGFGPIAPHWPARAQRAGTYDKAWQQRRAPLPPADFDPAFYNVAPADQQLASYLRGEEVRLQCMTVNGRDRFLLPKVREPVLVATEDALVDVRTTVDTIVIEPGELRFSVIARAQCPLAADAPTVYEVVIGDPTRSHRRALETGKRYLRWRAEQTPS